MLKQRGRRPRRGLHHPPRALRAGRGAHQGSALDEIVVTDTIPLSEAARACSRIRQLSVAELLAETLRRINEADSVSSLYFD